MGQGATASCETAINGGKYINDTAAHAGDFMGIQVVGDAPAVISSSGSTSNIDDFDVDITLSAGQTMYGRFAQITLVAGEVVAYKR